MNEEEIIKEYDSYDKDHTIDHCDRCLKKVGFENLFIVPFSYLDKNDHTHKDLGRGYRQYMVCKVCIKTTKV